MAMRAAATTTPAVFTAQRGFRAMYSSFPTFPFNQVQTKVENPPSAEPSTNLFVSGLNKQTKTEGLRDAFAKFGQVVHAKVVTDRSGYSRAFGFVEFATIEDATKGMKGMDGKFLDGWVIFAEYAKPRAPIPPLNNAFTQGRR
ncbi:glycine-rich RNA-binding protein 2 mitochondrial [Phtheirospermum japonicum]|uniref:Glycine-rich RNA-binding protein 2 mitochondrial n=1 Tax=Phtheirospermum japonicum TaxID=374723 RepID=A0A830C1L1_9LAMI|nr:glycine-rich RNA-binding protein 2 mitochondrial [Phtheirospermum japonicum]